METTNENIIRLLEMLDNPEAYTEQEILDIINHDDETREAYSLMVEAKRSSRRCRKEAAVDVDATWQRFVEAHPQLGHSQLGHSQLAHPQPLPKGGESQSSENKRKQVPLPWGGDRGGPDRVGLSGGGLPGGGPVPYHKVAASFIGVLLVSGIAFAAIQIVRNINTSKPQLATTEQATDIEPGNSLVADTTKAETIPSEPYVFNNVPLDSMLTAIAAAHGVGVEFENESARQLRFHFIWKREDSLDRIVEKLNTFEAVNIGVEDKMLVVR